MCCFVVSLSLARPPLLRVQFMSMLSSKVTEDICSSAIKLSSDLRVQFMWMLSSKVTEDIFRKQLERVVGAVVTHLKQGQPLPGQLYLHTALKHSHHL